jgi:hypothetical protein
MMQNAQGKPTPVEMKKTSKYVASAQKFLSGDNNDKRPADLFKMALGLLETTQDITHSTQATRNVA